MARVKTFSNGGSLLPTDLNAIEDDYEFAFSTYKTLAASAYQFNAAGSGTFVFVDGGLGTGVSASGATAGFAAQYIDPAQFAADSRTTYLNLRLLALANGTASGVNFTAGLYPVTAVDGGSAANTLTLGGVLTGSTATANTPGSNTEAASASGDFACPVAGLYALGVIISGAMAANSSVLLRARLFVRQV